MKRPVAVEWVQERGDIVWLEFDPQAGEQAGRQPAVVLSPASYNAPTGRALCVPVTTKAKGYPFEIALPPDCPVQGVAFANQVKCLDWRARHARPAAVLSTDVVAQILVRTCTGSSDCAVGALRRPAVRGSSGCAFALVRFPRHSSP